MASFIQVDADVYVNQDQVQIIRQATPSEMMGRTYPVTVIVMQNDVRFYVHNAPSEVAKKIKIEEVEIVGCDAKTKARP